MARLPKYLVRVVGLVAPAPALVFLAAFSACGGSSNAAQSPSSSSTSVEVSSNGASVRSLQISPDSLRVDKVGGRDAYLYPDGLLDISFVVDVTGPLSALFLMSTDERGEPDNFFRVNTLIGIEEAPQQFGGTLELGRMSSGLGVLEDGKWINKGDGSVSIPAGPHHLTLYTSNMGGLQSGRHLRVFGVLSDKSVIKGPILTLP
ncbi:hypothetical protein LVJ94_24575 [Pendulispora rubella]|uniref:Lipoprotein n=1 Tax=Pendulispora rubella TaxID=2741070 RepID=A0ABZ2LJ31_9BACT